ncbi:conserved hypothetical protein [Ricinus communis]|uniref:Uncharacterized protein n=1 Tax=Ricinus communis TaxID=3988 RepID=B9T379_RICCO|nr:conserved hypothetical protein [Ricinus communis]
MIRPRYQPKNTNLTINVLAWNCQGLGQALVVKALKELARNPRGDDKERVWNRIRGPKNECGDAWLWYDDFNVYLKPLSKKGTK